MTPGKLYRLNNLESATFQEIKTNIFLGIKKSDCLLFLYSFFSYSGSVYYFLFDNKIIYRHYAYEILEEINVNS